MNKFWNTFWRKYCSHVQKVQLNTHVLRKKNLNHLELQSDILHTSNYSTVLSKPVQCPAESPRGPLAI